MTIADVISLLEVCSKILFKWFDVDYMKDNGDKSPLLLNFESDVDVTANINRDNISNS